MSLPMLAKLDRLVSIAREPIESLNIFLFPISKEFIAYFYTGSIAGSFIVSYAVIIKKFCFRVSNLDEK